LEKLRSTVPNSGAFGKHPRRTARGTFAFTEKINEATQGHFQITTDGFKPYVKLMTKESREIVRILMAGAGGFLELPGALPDGAVLREVFVEIPL
jgi:hypothetical protein